MRTRGWRALEIGAFNTLSAGSDAFRRILRLPAYPLYDDIYSCYLLWCGRELAPPSTVIIRLNFRLLTLPLLQKPAARISAEKIRAERKGHTGK